MAKGEVRMTIQDQGIIGGDPAVELSSNRTAMSFERTHLSIDRTLMSVVRTSLSLIGFGFTIFQVFNNWIDRMPDAIRTGQPRHLALVLVGLGIALLVFGLVAHWRGCRRLDARRQRLHDLGLIHHSDKLGPTSTAVIAFLLLIAGVGAFADIAVRLVH